jgi:hypothetical protein
MLVLSASVISSAEEAGGEVVIKLSGENCQESFSELQEYSKVDGSRDV